MAIDRLSRLYAALGHPAQGIDNSTTSTPIAQQSLQNFDSEAAEVDATIGAESGEGTARAARIAELTKAVREGSYHVDSEKVARAFLQEII